MMGVSKYVLPCVTLNVVLRGRGPNITRGKRQKKSVACFDRVVLCITFPVPALKHHRGTAILV